MRRTLTVLATLALFACTSTSSTSSTSPKPVTETPAASPATTSIGNVRVIMYQSKQDLMMVLVNESHADRKTERGRLELGAR
jgi:hypothetical protein